MNSPDPHPFTKTDLTAVTPSGRTMSLSMPDAEGWAQLNAADENGLKRRFQVPPLCGCSWVDQLAFDAVGNPLLIGKDPASGRTAVATYELSARVQSSQIRLAVALMDAPPNAPRDIRTHSDFAFYQTTMELLNTPEAISKRATSTIHRLAPQTANVQAKFFREGSDFLMLSQPVAADSFRGIDRHPHELLEIARAHFDDIVVGHDNLSPERGGAGNGTNTCLERYGNGSIVASVTLVNPFRNHSTSSLAGIATKLAEAATPLAGEIAALESSAVRPVIDNPALQEALDRVDQISAAAPEIDR